MNRSLFHQAAITLSLLVTAAVSVNAQSLTVSTNKIANQQINNTALITSAAESHVQAQNAIIQAKLARLAELQQQALSLVAVKRELRCCQLVGVDVPFNDAATYINHKDHGKVFMGKGFMESDDTAAIDVKPKASSFSPNEIADIMAAAEKMAVGGQEKVETEEGDEPAQK
jgi:hypothetical protein